MFEGDGASLAGGRADAVIVSWLGGEMMDVVEEAAFGYADDL